jgi:hypothetical protein
VVSHPCRDETASRMGHPRWWLIEGRADNGLCGTSLVPRQTYRSMGTRIPIDEDQSDPSHMDPSLGVEMGNPGACCGLSFSLQESGLYPVPDAIFIAAMPSSTLRSEVVFTDLQDPPALMAIANAAAAVLSGKSTTTIVS